MTDLTIIDQRDVEDSIRRAFDEGRAAAASVRLDFDLFRRSVLSRHATHRRGRRARSAIHRDIFLAVACCEGDCGVARDAFARRFGPRIRKVCSGMASARSEADEFAWDFVGDLLVANRRASLRSYAGSTSLDRWLQPVIRRSWTRARGSRMPGHRHRVGVAAGPDSAIDDDPPLDAMHDSRELLRRLAGAYRDAALSPAEARAVYHKYALELPQRESAERIGVHPSTLSWRLEKVRAKLRSSLESTFTGSELDEINRALESRHLRHLLEIITSEYLDWLRDLRVRRGES